MKLPNSKIYWADYLSYSSMLTPDEICEVLKIIACRAMCYNPPTDENLSVNLSDNPQDNLSVSKQRQRQIQIQKLNETQREFYLCLAKAQDESARDYIAKVNNGRKGGRPKAYREEEKLSPSYPQEAEDRSLQAKKIINTLANNLSVKNHSEIKGKTVHIVEGEFFMDETMPDYKSFLVGLSDQEITKLWGWIRDKYYGQHLPVSKIQQMIKNFNTNLQKGA